MENISKVREKVKQSGLSKNAKKMIYSVLESSNYSTQGVEKKAWINRLHGEWASYVEAQQTIKENMALQAKYEKRLKLSRRTLGLIKKPTPPQLKPVREFTASPIPCNDSFQNICFEVFRSGYIETKTVDGQEHICPTAKLIQP
jgi:hypothetical protein